MKRKALLSATGTAALMFVVLSGRAAAQTGPAPAAPSRTTSYSASFFAQYAPRTALDVARRVPGFSLDLGNTEIRGFAGAAGNVVINGQRPSNKSETLDQTLAKIPADQIVRVEVGPGDIYGADYAGKNQVLNLVIAAGKAAMEGNVTASARRFFTGALVGTASGTVSLRRGPSNFSLSGGVGNTDTYERGPDALFVPANGPVVERRLRTNHYFNRLPFIAGNWSLGTAADRSAHLNLRYQRGRYGVRQTNHVTPVAAPEHDDQLIQRYLRPSFEIGGDVSRPLAGGALKFVGLYNRGSREDEDRYIGGPPAIGGFHQTQQAKTKEAIVRGSWTRSDVGGFSFEAGVEAAYNSLDNHLELSIVNLDGSVTPINLPIDNATVTERRAEAYVSVGRALGPTLHLDGGLRYETSTLKVRGDATSDTALKFLKPDLALDWNSHGWHSRLSLRRTVAQLNFFDFISGAEVAAGRVNGGNANLVPQQTWEARFTLEHPILRNGLFKFDLGYDRVNELQDRILTPEGFDAPGNLGTGTRRFATLTLDAPLDRLGVKGGRLKLSGTWQNTRVVDPSTHQVRRWTDQQGQWSDWQWSAEYRQDLGQWSYGATISDQQRNLVFRTDEISELGQLRPFGTAFVEFRPNARTTITLDVDNALDSKALWARTFFSPNRTNPVPYKYETRTRNSHTNIGLTAKRIF